MAELLLFSLAIFQNLIASNFLSNLKTVRRVGTVFEVVMAKKVELSTHFLNTLLKEANAVGEYCGVDKLEFV